MYDVAYSNIITHILSTAATEVTKYCNQWYRKSVEGPTTDHRIRSQVMFAECQRPAIGPKQSAVTQTFSRDDRASVIRLEEL